MSEQVNPFVNLTFDRFRQMALDKDLSQYEKVGFPDSYRKDREELIFMDILAKVPAFSQTGATIVDIGPGCSDLPGLYLKNAEKHSQHLIFIDSREMLDLIPNSLHLEKIAAQYPRCDDFFTRYAGRIDAVTAYSVTQYIFAEGNVYEYLDKTLELLAPGGHFFMGDIPNISKRKRFFTSAAGEKFHKDFTNSDKLPVVQFNISEPGQMDDSVVLAIAARARSQGFDSYILPQSVTLPMANRREDLLVVRP